MTPSRPAPSNRANQSAASARSSVVGVTWTPGTPASDAGGQAAATLGERALAQVLVVDGEEVPGDVAGRRPRGQEPDARLGRVDPEEEGVEVEAAGSGDDDLAVDDGPLGEGRPQRRLELREVAVERPQVAALHQELVAVAEDERPGSRPTWARTPSRDRRAATAGASRASARAEAGTGGARPDYARRGTLAHGRRAARPAPRSGGLVGRVVRPPDRRVDRRRRERQPRRSPAGSGSPWTVPIPRTTAIAIARDTARSSETGG